MKFVLILAPSTGLVTVDAAVRFRVVSGHAIRALLIANALSVVIDVEVLHLTPIEDPAALTIGWLILVALPARVVTIEGGHESIRTDEIYAVDLQFIGVGCNGETANFLLIIGGIDNTIQGNDHFIDISSLVAVAKDANDSDSLFSTVDNACIFKFLVGLHDTGDSISDSHN